MPTPRAESQKPDCPILLTGDTPTGRLHLGHWVGSLENRVRLQENHLCYFLIANVHAFTTRAQDPESVRAAVRDILLDYLSVGIDPNLSVVFLQSEIPAIAELTFWFAMLLSYPRVLRNPTLKDEIRDKGLGDQYSFGFLMYPVGQVADILAFRPHVVPVGEDQIPHLEMAKETARRFNQWYCGVGSEVEDADQEQAGGLFPIFRPLLGRVKRLVGLGAPQANGQLLKMSKSFNNAIWLSDSPDAIQAKVMQMYTDPNRIRATDKGQVENNPLWIFHDTFNPDKTWVEEAKEAYRAGQIGDVTCKRRLIEVLVALTEPFRTRRALYEGDEAYLMEILKAGCDRANARAESTLSATKEALKQGFFTRHLVLE